MSVKPEPPKFAMKLLQWFCKPWYVEVIEGDLYELFDREAEYSPNVARWKFTWNVIRFFRWRYIKDLDDFVPKSPFGMFKTYFKVSFRNMAKNKAQSLLNIMGLAIGIACCVIILTHVRHQTSFDKNIPQVEDIYRVTINGRGPYTPAQLVKYMKADYPEILNGTRLGGLGEVVIKQGDQFIKQQNVLMADSTFFDLFPNTFIRGEAKTALNGPNDVVLTESMAQKYFPEKDPIGEIIEIDEVKCVIKAIVKDAPRATTIPYQIIQSIPWEKWATTGNWTGNNFYSYFKLAPGADPEILESKFPSFIEKYMGDEILKFNPQYNSYQEFVQDNNQHTFVLIPMRDIHLHHPRLTLGTPGNYNNLIIFSLVALFILLLACINYVNMATAKSSLRAKEIGIRKVLGSVKNLIAQQFMVESFVITGVAIFIAIGLTLIVLPYFNLISENQYEVLDIISLRNIGWFFVIWVVVGLLAGLYPASFLSSFKPIAALKGESKTGGNQRLRSSLVVLQFAISMFLMVATFIVYAQLRHMSNRNLGLDAEQVFILSDADKIVSKMDRFKSLLMGNSNISNVAFTSGYPSGIIADWGYHSTGENVVSVDPLNVFADPNILDVWGLELTEGRFFEPGLKSDSMTIVINEQLQSELGWKDPIGKNLSRGGGQDFRVIGVVRDFVTRSAKNQGSSLLFRWSSASTPFANHFASIKVKGNITDALDHIDKTWANLLPGFPMDGQFMDDSFQRLYEGEKRFGKMFTGASVLAIIIACIGLFSLTAFILERKKKEIALRKVMGARVDQLFYGVSRYFVRLVLISAVLAIPISFYVGDFWLSSYVDRISLNTMIFLIPLLLMLAISLITISYQTYRSTVKNPVEALKEE